MSCHHASTTRRVAETERMEKIGSGSYGVVFAHGDGKVAKYGRLERECETGRRLAQLEGNDRGRFFVVLEDGCGVSDENAGPVQAASDLQFGNELWMGLMPRADGDVIVLSVKWGGIFWKNGTDPASASTMGLSALANVATGLLLMHSNGFIHMDVKPQNVLYIYRDRRLALKLCDFGNAIRADEQRFTNRLKDTQLYYPRKFACSDNLWTIFAGQQDLSADLTGDLTREESHTAPTGADNVCSGDPYRRLGIACDWFGFGCVVDKLRYHLILSDDQQIGLSNFFRACASGSMSDADARIMLPLCGIDI